MTTLSKFQLQLRGNILQQLETGPKTTRQIANTLDANYFTVRVAMRNLENEGTIRGLYSSRGRDIKYEIGTSNTVSNIIPVMHYRSVELKLHNLINKHDSMGSTQLIKSIASVPLLVLQLMKAAERLNEGPQDQTLTTIRASIEQALHEVEMFATLLQQILNEPKTWNPEILKRYPLDEDYDSTLINELFNHYFHTEE